MTNPAPRITNYNPLEPIQTIVQESLCDAFTVNTNYEILNDTGDSLLNTKALDSKALLTFFNALYKNLPSFVLTDTVADFHTFRHRLDNLSFLKARHNHDTLAIKKLSRALAMAQKDHAAPIRQIKIDCFTLRVCDEIGVALNGKAFLSPNIKVLLKGFCMQLEVSKEDILLHGLSA